MLDFDHGAHRAFKPYRDTLGVRMLDWPSKLADQPQLRLIAGALIMAGIFARSDRMVRAGARMMIAHEAATFAKDRVKIRIDRKRPRSAARRDEKRPRKGKHTAKELTSFPSGHSAGAIAAARALSREYPEHAPAIVSAAGIIAVLQVPRRAHYPTDVVAGLAIGLAAEAGVNAAWTAGRMDERSEVRA